MARTNPNDVRHHVRVRRSQVGQARRTGTTPSATTARRCRCSTYGRRPALQLGLRQRRQRRPLAGAGGDLLTSRWSTTAGEPTAGTTGPDRRVPEVHRTTRTCQTPRRDRRPQTARETVVNQLDPWRAAGIPGLVKNKSIVRPGRPTSQPVEQRRGDRPSGVSSWRSYENRRLGHGRRRAERPLRLQPGRGHRAVGKRRRPIRRQGTNPSRVVSRWSRR